MILIPLQFSGNCDRLNKFYYFLMESPLFSKTSLAHILRGIWIVYYIRKKRDELDEVHYELIKTHVKIREAFKA